MTATRNTITLDAGTYAAPTGFVGPLDILGHGATLQGPINVDAGTTTFEDLSIDGTTNIDATAAGVFLRVTTNGPFNADGELTLDTVDSSGYMFSYKMVTIRRTAFYGSTASMYISGGWDVTNSIFARGVEPVRLVMPDGTHPQRFESNTIVDNSPDQTTTVLDLSCENGAAGIMRNVVIWSSFAPSGGHSVTNCGLSYSLVYTGTTTPYTGTGNIVGDPKFVRLQPAGSLPADFHLTGDSPALNVADQADPIADDIDGDPRPFGSGPDIGADELTQ